jgi:DNA topoisomerase-3
LARRVKAATAAQFKIVKQLVGQAAELVIATDADREGE